VDFSLILFLFLALTGAILLLDKLLFAPQRSGDTVKLPLIVEYAKSLFPVILLVFVLRSFIVEPFRIPSGSMLPSLHIGDFILVNKFKYGIRLPVINKKIFDLGDPQRGDVTVFRFPHDPKVNFIKRVVGVPGDTILYVDKQLFVNGRKVDIEPAGEYAYQEASKRGKVADRYLEALADEGQHEILIDNSRTGREMEIRVPEGKYFVMGDNRDHSNDSRYWGFVPDENLVGKAFFIWFSWKSATGGGVEWKRIGNIIN